MIYYRSRITSLKCITFVFWIPNNLKITLMLRWIPIKGWLQTSHRWMQKKGGKFTQRKELRSSTWHMRAKQEMKEIHNHDNSFKIILGEGVSAPPPPSPVFALLGLTAVTGSLKCACTCWGWLFNMTNEEGRYPHVLRQQWGLLTNDLWMAFAKLNKVAREKGTNSFTLRKNTKTN